MELKVLRFSSQKDSTSGLLFEKTDSGLEFLCYTLEDEARGTKVRSETRIPFGTYEVKLRKEGGFNKKYNIRFSAINKVRLHVQNLPNFEYILIHCGNTDEHTSGCLLLGDSQENNIIKKDGFIGSSSKAYSRIYPRIAKALESGEKVIIKYIDYDRQL